MGSTIMTSQGNHPFNVAAHGIALAALFTAAISAGSINTAWAEVRPAAQMQPDALTNARAEINRGNVRAGVIALKNLIRANPALIEARVELAIVYAQLNDGLSAEKEWRAAIQGGYPFDKALDGLAGALLMQGDGRRLLKEFDAAKYTGEVRARVHLQRALADLALGDNPSAKQEVAFAQAIAPDYFGVHLAQARFHQIEGDLKAADAEIDRALTTASNNIDVLNQKGEIRGALGDTAGALQYFDKCLALRKNDLRAHLGHIAALVAQNKQETAEAEVDDVLKLAPGMPAAVYFKALLLAQRGKSADALALLSPVPGIEKLQPALYLLAALHLSNGQPEQAQRYVGAYLAKAPDDMKGQLLQVTLQLARGEINAAIQKLETLKTNLPSDYTTGLLLGNAYLSVGRYSDAAEQFQAAATASPQAADASLGLAQSLMAEGKANEGAKVLQALPVQSLGDGRTETLLIASLIKSKQFDAASKAAADYQTREPKSPVPLYLRASIDAARNDRAAIRKDLAQALVLDPAFVPAHLALAVVDRTEGKPEDAKAHYQAILAHSPSDLDAQIGLATLAVDAGDKEGAADWLRKAAAANPNTPTPRVLLINLLLMQHRAEDALKEATELAAKMPANALAVDALGVCQLATRDGPGAVATFTKFVGLAPNAAAARLKLAAAYRLADKADDARRAVEAALKLDPQSAEARRALIELALAKDGPAAAIKLAKTARDELHDKAAGGLILGDTYRLTGQLADAEATYGELWAKTPSASLLTRYTQTLDAQNKLALSRTVIAGWLKSHPSDGNARFLLVVNSINTKQYAVALTDAESLLKDRPTDVALLNNAAWLYAQAGNQQRAIECAEKAYAQAPWSAEIGDTLGWLLVNNNKLERAVTLLKTAHDAAPTNAEIAYHYSYALSRSGKSADARSLLGQALKSNQQFAERKDAEKFLASLQ